MIKLYTIGVYNSTEDDYFSKLMRVGVDLFCDIRQRRGVRGSQYRFVNSNYLQNKLKELSIAYKYIKELAPTSDIREKQKRADKLNGETKKQRTVLGEVFVREYKEHILGAYDMEQFAKELRVSGFNNIAFFCVEEHAEACHRSLVVNELAKILNCEVENL